MSLHYRWHYLMIALLGLILFLPGLGNVHLFDWDEINFAECAREMLVTKNYLRVQIDFQPFWEKPPLFIWLQAASMAAFGVNEFAARLPNALVGVATLLSVYHVGRRLAGGQLGLIWSLLYAASWLPHFYFKSGIIDPLFNLLIFGALYQLHRVSSARRKAAAAVAGGVLLGLAILTKGPVALLLAGLCIVAYAVWNKGLRGIPVSQLLLAFLITMVTACSWFAVEVALHGWALVQDFLAYQVRLFRTEDAGHGGPFYYHFIVLLVGCFPASVFLFQRQKKTNSETPELVGFGRWMWILFWVVLLLFSIVRTKIVHYSSLCYFPLTFLAALQVWRGLQLKLAGKYVAPLLLFIGLLLAAAITLLPLAGMHKAPLIHVMKDPFAAANLAANVHWSSLECCYGIAYAAGIIGSVLLFRRRQLQGLAALIVVQLFAIQAAVYHFVPKVEPYSQGAAIEYFQSFKGRNAYVMPLGYKSYAHLFYSQKPPPASDSARTDEWYRDGATDKPAYFICRITDAEKWATIPQLQETGRKNGFVFFRRIYPALQR